MKGRPQLVRPRRQAPADGATDAGPTPRELAFEALLRVAEGAFCDALVGASLARHPLPPRERGLFTRLVYGTVTWQGRLDWTIAALARRPIESITLPALVALRLGLFQVTRLERVPAHAAVDTSVALAKRAAGAGAAGFVNALLRTALRRGGEATLPDEREDPVRGLAVAYSHPTWLVERWISELGLEEARALVAANNEPAPTVLRIDRRLRERGQAITDLANAGITTQPTPYAPYGVIVESGVGDALDLAWAPPQGEASQLVAELVAPRLGERIVDLCAAPGGKANALAEMLGSSAAAAHPIVAVDRSSGGCRRVAASAQTGRPRDVVVTRGDARRPPFAGERFDAVLVDAPCSGLGTLRAHPEIRWRRRPEDLVALARAQRAMLRAAAALVRPGGRLVYSTCAVTREENEEVIAALDDPGRTFRLVDARRWLPPAAAELVDDSGALRTSPDRGGLDGFYAARFERVR